MQTIETCPFWLYSYILWKGMYRNTQYMCKIFEANIIWRSGHAIRSSLPLNFSSFHHDCRRASQFFFASQLCNVIVLAAPLMGTLFGRQIVLQCTKKKWSERNRKALRSVITYFKYIINHAENVKKYFVSQTHQEQMNTLGVPHYPQEPKVFFFSNLAQLNFFSEVACKGMLFQKTFHFARSITQRYGLILKGCLFIFCS